MQTTKDIKTGKVYGIEWSIRCSAPDPRIKNSALQEHTTCTLYEIADEKPTMLGHSHVTRKYNEKNSYYLAMHYSLEKVMVDVFPSAYDMLELKKSNLDVELEHSTMSEGDKYDAIEAVRLTEEEQQQALENKRIRAILWFVLVSSRGIEPQQASKQKPENNGTTTSIEARTEASH